MYIYTFSIYAKNNFLQHYLYFGSYRWFFSTIWISVSLVNALIRSINRPISTIDNLYQNSIAHITNLILSKLIDNGIAHNLILTHQGTIFYLVPI